MRRLILILAAMACLGMTGCGGTKHMQPVDPAKVSATYDTVNSDEAAIVFFRHSVFSSVGFQGALISPGLIEADENGKLSFVAIMSKDTKYLHRTTPGRHSYFWSSGSLQGGMASYILQADLEAGKIYYIDTFVSSEGFIPVTDTSDGAFIKGLNSCRWVENTSDGQLWFNDNLPSLQNKYTQAQGRGTILLKPEYGATTPVQ